MAELKTKPTKASVPGFLNKVADKSRREDCLKVLEIMKDVTGEDPEMWGDSIVGFGRYRYEYESGTKGEWMITGFSPRKGDLTLYLMSGFDGVADLMSRLGKHKTGKSCLYLKKLADVDVKVLRKIVEKSVKGMASRRIQKET
ncbi:MAG TPA: DUF1801 domain-containing protein [Pyrinomonadaceae bacterium]|nr:DUF1801 domain-containing protein [Pyrinomonadaceae bacterium]